MNTQSDQTTNKKPGSTITKLKYTFYFALFALIAIIVVIVAILNKEKQPKTEIKEFQELKLVSITPNPAIYKSIWSTDPIVVTFDHVIDHDTLKYQVTPRVNTQIVSPYEPSTKITLISLEGWKHDVEYTLIIENTLTSLDNSFKLKDPIVYKFLREVPKPGDPEYPSMIEEKVPLR